MYEGPGLAYLYFIYGMHVCFNVVSGRLGKPEAILIRAIEPTSGMEEMSRNRRFGLYDQLTAVKRRQLTNGPGKLVQALGIGLECYGHDLRKPPLFIRLSHKSFAGSEIATGPRIGIENTGEARDYPYRFWVRNHPFVSK